MSEWRIAEVVSQTCGSHYCSYLLKQAVGKFRVSLCKYMTYVIAQRHSHRCYFKRVGEPVVDEYASRQRKHLCLVLQPAERSREYQAVVVALEFCAVIISGGMSLFLSQPFVGYQFFPVHHATKVLINLKKPLCSHFFFVVLRKNIKRL